MSGNDPHEIYEMDSRPGDDERLPLIGRTDDDMPANCTDCEGVWDLNALYSSPDGAVLCGECRDARDEADEHWPAGFVIKPTKEMRDMTNTGTYSTPMDIIDAHELIESGAYARCSCGVEFYFYERATQYRTHIDRLVTNAVTEGLRVALAATQTEVERLHRATPRVLRLPDRPPPHRVEQREGVTMNDSEVERLQRENEQLRAKIEAVRAACNRGGDAPSGELAWKQGWAQGYTDCGTAVFAALAAVGVVNPDTDERRERSVDPETFCHRCNGPNVSWCAPSPLWNAVMRLDPDVLLWNEIICPTCFAVLAEEAGIARDWRLTAATELVPIRQVSPDGRVWDEERFLWTTALAAGVLPTTDERAAQEADAMMEPSASAMLAGDHRAKDDAQEEADLPPRDAGRWRRADLNPFMARRLRMSRPDGENR